MSNRVYDVLKWVAMFFLPALAILIKSLGHIWGFAWAQEVADTVVAVNAMLAAVLGISSVNYYGGDE